MRKTAFFLLCFLFAALPAQADSYPKPTWQNLLNTLIRFNAMDISDDQLLDNYAMVTECDLYKAFYRDDFKWAKVRAAIRDSVRKDVATFPTGYSYLTQLQLDRYDFHNNLYRFTPKTTLRNVNTVLLYKVEGSPCDGIEVKYIPTSFRGVLDTPISFDGLPLANKDAEALLQQMKDDKNVDRVVYTSLNLRVIYVEPLRLGTVNNEEKRYMQANMTDPHQARMDMQLDSIEFYEDEAMTKLIYRYQP